MDTGASSGVAFSRDSFGHWIVDQIIRRQLRGNVTWDRMSTGLRTTIAGPLQTGDVTKPADGFHSRHSASAVGQCRVRGEPSRGPSPSRAVEA